MPLLLTAPQIQTIFIDRQQIVSFSVDVATTLLYIVYADGRDDAGAFIPVGDLKQINVSTDEFLAALSVHSNQSLYGDIKTLLYSLLTAATGVAGTVA